MGTRVRRLHPPQRTDTGWLDDAENRTLLRRLDWAAGTATDEEFDHLEGGHCPKCLGTIHWLVGGTPINVLAACPTCHRGWRWGDADESWTVRLAQ